VRLGAVLFPVRGRSDRAEVEAAVRAVELPLLHVAATPWAWTSGGRSYETEPGERIWVGVDLGGTRALSSVAWCTEDGRVGTRSYRGEEGPLFCQAQIEELAGSYSVAEVAADPWRAAPMLLELG
jgi:hypothetical protein